MELKDFKTGITNVTGKQFIELQNMIIKQGGTRLENASTILLSEKPYHHLCVRRMVSTLGRVKGYIVAVDKD